MGKAHGSGTNLHDVGKVVIVVFVGQCTAQSQVILVATYTIHRILFSVKVKAFACYHFIMTNTERLHHFIDGFAILHKTGYYLIKIRVFASLPKMWIF